MRIHALTVVLAPLQTLVARALFPSAVFVGLAVACLDARFAHAQTADGGAADGGVPEGGAADGGVPEGGAADGGVPDGGAADGGAADGGAADGGAAERPRTGLVAPRLLEAPEISLPGDAAPIPPDSGVALRLTVTPTGTVEEAVIESGVRDDVDALVVAAARAMRFEPALRDGEPIAATIRFRFAVESPPPDLPADTEAAPAGQASPNVEIPPPGEETEPEPAGPEPVFGATARVERPDPGAATRITLTAEELTTVPGTFGEPLRVVATLPGVVRTPFGLGFFFVRGASFENTGFFVDGFPVPLLYHLGAGPAVLSSRLVRQLDFYPGGYPARFGRFSAGVIALETAAPEVESTHLELEVDLLKASALAIVPFDGDRATITLAYRRSYYELLLPLIVDGIELSYADWQARLDYEINEQLEASLFYFGSADALDLTQALGAGVGDEQTQSALSYGFHRLIGKLIFRLPHDIRLTWSGTVGIDQTEITRTDPGGTDLSAEITGTYLGQRLELVVPEGEHLQTVAGVDVLTTAYDAVSTLPAPRGLGLPPQPLPNAPTSAVGIRPIVASATPYIEQTLRLDPIEIAAAARLEYYQYASVDNVYFDPRGVVRYQMLDELVWKAATGLFTQPPQPFQIDPAVGNPELPPQRSWQTSAGLELDLPWKIDIESQVFYSRMMDLPRNVFQPDPDDPSRQQLFVADGEGQSYGWELLARREANEGFYGWLSYTLSWSERFLDGGNTVPFFFDQRHTLNLALSYAFDGWRFGARFQLSSGRPQRPVLGCEEDLDADRCSFIRGGLTERGPVYHQLDIRIDREFKLSRHFLLSIYLDVLNVYYAQNEEGRIYQWDSTRSAALPGIPTIGTIGVRMEYE